MKKYVLKPCPICGAEAVVINRDGVGNVTCSKECEFYKKIYCATMYGKESWYCTTMFQFGNHVGTKKKEAIKQWNDFELPKSFEQERETLELDKNAYLFDTRDK